ncbi:MAG: hypothetical protein AB9866_07250 [Syntrophobacteraceae bacterium]
MKNKEERAKKANKTYCDGHGQHGIEPCNWEEMPGYDKFLKGEITESELSRQAKEELAQLTKSFSKYLQVDTEKENRAASETRSKEEKAKIANKIYRKACGESGKDLCFFKNFTAWQEFVNGDLKDDEFYEKALDEIKKVAEQEA